MEVECSQGNVAVVVVVVAAVVVVVVAVARSAFFRWHRVCFTSYCGDGGAGWLPAASASPAASCFNASS
ncbi:hypothetical protein NL529_27395, partial [Klebsiella pneumoniae]|nr:hypothetical protein [Klebsiella pneumoniae]